MKKPAKLTVLVAGMAMSAAVAINAAPRVNHRAKRDAEIIIEVDRSLATLTEEGVLNSQKAVENRIAKYVTTNFTVTDRFHVLNNAFAIRVNSAYIDSIKQIPGVKSVTKNEAHFVSEIYDQNDGLFIPLDNGDPSTAYGGSTNYSAKTMHKPDDTNDGEGTVIAVLDNEFYFRAEHTETKGGVEQTVDSWEHVAFTRLEDSVVKRFDFKTPGTYVEPARGTSEEQAASKAAHLEWIKGTHAATKHPVDDFDVNEDYDTDPNKETTIANTPLGKEGSLYFNSKVPFYFDYGGDKKKHSDYCSFDYDVSSTTSYHGSHVASIATGNDPDYQGIAPNAQLVCMKVFSEYKPTDVEEAVGQQAGSYGYDIPILKALEDCIVLGVDGINMSLGNSLDDFGKDSITNKTLKRLADGDPELGIEPILTSISAGNDGKTSYAFAGGYGNWTFDMVETGCQSGHSNIDSIMGVASGQPTHKFYTTAFKLGDEYIQYEDQIVNREGYPDSYDDEHKFADLVENLEPGELHWVFVPGFGEKADYDALGGVVSGNIAIVMRGSTTFVDKYKQAVAAGAIGLVIINNDPTASSFNMRMDFSDEQPTIPVAMVLYGDKQKFGAQGVKTGGDFTIIHDQIGENVREYTLSDFSSDGGTYDLQLKPEIAAPGDNIKGAVPPQKKEHKEQSPLSTYEFLSGTSMSAPNYAGAQSVLLSSKAKSIYADGNPSTDDLADLYTYRKSIDMRLMSTANPMKDFDSDPELYYDSKKAYDEAKEAGTPEEELPDIIERNQYTSPRIQGAGMANIGAALSTNVYLEGLKADGNGLGKAKIELRNNQDINEGKINLKFRAHNEGSQDQTYGVTVHIMRPAIKHSADVLTKEYNYIGEVTSIENFPGRKYYVAKSTYNPDDPDHPYFDPAVEQMSEVDFAKYDVYKVPRDIEYWATPEACAADHPAPGVETKDHISIIPAGKYVNVGDDVTAIWELAPDYPYQSTQDTEIATVALADVTFTAESTTELDLAVYQLTQEQKDKIAASFEYGCYLEGYIEFTSKTVDQPDLVMPYMGFYGGVDAEGRAQDYGTAPVVEPFSFEKDAKKIYPSDLVNDLGKSLLGLANVDMGSEWITTYIEPGKSFNDEDIITNKDSLSNLAKDEGYHVVGTDTDGNRYKDGKIYVGSSETSNTMIIQQFVLRSCMDNFYEIKNSSNKVVYRGALKDMLYGGDLHSWQLYKSHVDSGFLGGGYLAHRAWAVIPLYDKKGQPFPSGDYTMEFNYILSSTGETVTNKYQMVIDSDTPTVTNLKETNDSIVLEIEEANFDSLFLNGHDFTNPDPTTDHATLTHDYENNKHTLSIEKLSAIEIMNESLNRTNGYGRLCVGMYDKAYGYAGAVVKFNKLESYKDALKKYGEAADIYAYIPKFNNYTIVESTFFDLSTDIEVIGKTINYYILDGEGDPTPYDPSRLGAIKVTNYPNKKSGGSTSKGCGGNVVATSISLSALSGVLAISLIIATKRKKKEAK